MKCRFFDGGNQCDPHCPFLWSKGKQNNNPCVLELRNRCKAENIRAYHYDEPRLWLALPPKKVF